MGGEFFRLLGHVPDNFWLGTSITNQQTANIRIPELLKIPAKVRFLSVEPLLEEVDLQRYLGHEYEFGIGEKTLVSGKLPGVNWVIVGGESGPRKRPFDPDWARSLRDQCKEAGVPFFMKQVDKVKQIPDDLMVREFPK